MAHSMTLSTTLAPPAFDELCAQQSYDALLQPQAAAERANRLLAEANELRRTEYQRRYQLSQQKKATSNDHVTTQLAAENNTLRETIASLRGELARVQDECERLKNERDTLSILSS